MDKIKEKILDLAKKKGMSQTDICKELGITMNGFKSMFDNKTVKYSVLLKISEILAVPITNIIGVSSQKSKVQSDAFASDVVEQMQERIKLLESNNQLLQELVRKEYLGKRKGLTNTGTMQIAA